MSETDSRPVEVAWAAVAWTQFLISITVINKADMNLIWTFFRRLPAFQLQTAVKVATGQFVQRPEEWAINL